MESQLDSFCKLQINDAINEDVFITSFIYIQKVPIGENNDKINSL